MRSSTISLIVAAAALLVLTPALGAGAPASVLTTAPPAPSYWPTAAWRTASPASQGMDAAKLGAMLAAIKAKGLPIDSVTVVRHGHVVLNESFGRFAAGKLGEPFASGRLHELQSATKSVTSMLLGMALHQNAASGISLKTTLVQLAAARDSVPEHTDARKRALTIEDLLTMQSGLAWKEAGYAYTPGSGNDVMAMLATKSWIDYVIDRPMATKPGTTFVYSSGAAHVASAIVSILAGRPEAAFAAKQLFAPLGIREYKWLTAPEGLSSGGFGLQLKPLDLAKLAFLYLHQGRWGGRQIVPASWVEQSTTDHVADPKIEYGYLWWLDRADGYAYMAGLYGQLAAVDASRDLVAVFTGHFPGTVDANAVTRSLLESYILPAVTR